MYGDIKIKNIFHTNKITLHDFTLKTYLDYIQSICHTSSFDLLITIVSRILSVCLIHWLFHCSILHAISTIHSTLFASTWRISWPSLSSSGKENTMCSRLQWNNQCFKQIDNMCSKAYVTNIKCLSTWSMINPPISFITR